MKQWHCHIGGQQYGPVGEDQLQQWAREGRLNSSDLVWSDGMEQWQPAGQALPSLFASVPPGAQQAAPAPGGYAYGAPVAAPSLAGVTPPGGTGGLTGVVTLAKQAAAGLSGRWGLAIGFSFLLGLMMFGIAMLNLVIPILGSLVMAIVGGAFELGCAAFYLRFSRGGQGDMGMLFCGFSDFGRSIGAYWLRLLYQALCLIPALVIYILMIVVMFGNRGGGGGPAVAVAGIVALLAYLGGLVAAVIVALMYSQVMPLLADNPTMRVTEAFRRSKRMMNGNKGRLFGMQMYFVLWSLLAILTCGVGFLWLVPWMQASMARFYDDLLPGHQAALGTSGGGAGQAAALETVAYPQQPGV